MRTAVYQSFRTTDVPVWIERCMQSVKDWAACRGCDYHFIDDRLFTYAPTWYRHKVQDNVQLVSDLARLALAKELLGNGYDRTIWVDADVVVFDPERLIIPSQEKFALCHEIWVGQGPDGAPLVDHKINNAFLMLTQDNPFLDFYLHACRRIIAYRKEISPIDVGTRFLTYLGKYLDLPLITQVGLFSPLVMADIAQGDGAYLRCCMKAARSFLCAANLCAALRDKRWDGVLMTDTLYQKVVDQCIQSKGEVVNQFRNNLAENPPALLAPEPQRADSQKPIPTASLQEQIGTSLLVSTPTSLLHVTLDAQHRLQSVRRVHHGQGVYFGLARSEQRVYAMARNLNMQGKVRDSRYGVNAILEFTWPGLGPAEQLWQVQGMRDPHQMCFHDGLLWVVSGYRPELQAWNPQERRLVGQVFLVDLVPPVLRHAAPPHHPEDPYHFNSLHFSDNRLWVLAHNWQDGAFALELAYEGPASLFSQPRCLQVHAGLGLESHNVHVDGQGLLVLSSADNSVATASGKTHPVPGLPGQRGFLRGLGVDRQVLFLGQGTFSEERSGRQTGPTRIVVLERSTLHQLAVVDVGAYANPCDLLLLPGQEKGNRP